MNWELSRDSAGGKPRPVPAPPRTRGARAKMAAAAAATAASGAASSAAGSNGAGGMEVDGAAAPPVMAGGVPGSVAVALHPLVILNISDHWIRLRSQEGRPGQVIGALIGRQEGRSIEVMNSFELLSHLVDGHVLIDKEYYYTKEEQCEPGGGV
uniref:COP9 signalosome complex subunit 6 n=1 Tax=Strigops habroptila TaxID=2489341 RepID=A0A672URB9_STRHB